MPTRPLTHALAGLPSYKKYVYIESLSLIPTDKKNTVCYLSLFFGEMIGIWTIYRWHHVWRHGPILRSWAIAWTHQAAPLESKAQARCGETRPAWRHTALGPGPRRQECSLRRIWRLFCCPLHYLRVDSKKNITYALITGLYICTLTICCHKHRCGGVMDRCCGRDIIRHRYLLRFC